MQMVGSWQKVRTSAVQIQTGQPKTKEREVFIQANIHTIFGEVISRHRLKQNPAKVKVLMDMLPPKTKRELQLYLVIVNYLSRFSSMTVEVFKPLQRLTSVEAILLWNRTYQEI